MPSVSGPSDGGYTYTKSLGELEDEVRAEAKRNRQLQQEQTSELEDRYKAELRRKDAETERAVASVRESADEQNARDRGNYRSEIERLKGQTYDRFGRVGGEEADSLREQLISLQKSYQDTAAKNKQQLDESKETYDRRSEDQAKRHSEDMEKAVAATKEAYQQTYERASEERKTEEKENRTEQEERYTFSQNEVLDQANRLRKDTGKAVDEVKKDYEHQLDQQKKAFETQTTRHEEALARAMSDNTERTRTISDHENERLRGQVRDLLESDRRRNQERGSARAEAIHDLEDQWRTEAHSTSLGYEAQIENLKRHANDADHSAAQKQDELVRARDQYFTGLLRQENADHRLEEKEVMQASEVARNQLIEQNRHDRELAEQTLERQLDQANEARETALTHQGEQFQEALHRQKTSDQEQMNRLEKHLAELNSPVDSSQLTPAAESAVRKTLIKEYERTYLADQDRNKREIASLQESFSRKLGDTVMERDSRETAMMRNNDAERQQEKGLLLNHISEIEEAKNEERRSAEAANTREGENIRRNYEGLMERQRREYDDILEATRSDAQAKMSTMRQEADFASRMEHRAFNARENELIRDYERKLDDQKQELTAQIQEAKEEAQKAGHSSERQLRQTIEEHSRGYEQRIAQLEAKHQERERVLGQNYEEEMEKLKRSHALILQKKG